MSKHSFGGPWTFIKLDILNRYLSFFNTALQRQPNAEKPFDRVYIDAFAGTGECDIKLDNGNSLTIAGSAKIAIEKTTPGFHHVHLIDVDAKHAAQLEILASSNQDVSVTVYKNDANAALESIISKVNWHQTRGVVFLDPYGMALNWATIEKIAKTRALDVWYLFPLNAVARQAANDFTKIDSGKADSLDRLLGTTDWRTEFYQETAQGSFLAEGKTMITRKFGNAEIASYVHNRLSAVFHGWVSPPIFLPETGSPIFALFFAVANPSESAVKLSKKAAEHLFVMLKNKKIGRISGEAVTNDGQNELF
ncbi:MAG: three-Cys-motif partner protein TcmP [Pseudomonadota bacterium]